MLSGFATAQGTGRFGQRFPAERAAGFFRGAQRLSVSSIGIGTYLGEMDEATDQNYVGAIHGVLKAGVNFIDTSLNYRHQRSERCIGTALREAVDSGEIQRDEVVICTKAGYLTPDAVPADVLTTCDVVGGMHSMAPVFLADQLERSRKNLGIETIDVFYLHNPETQLGHIGESDFYGRMQPAFEWLEHMVAEGAILYYGTATWHGYRRPAKSHEALSLERLASIATEAGGAGHHFRFIQLPLNLGMTEALSSRVDGESVLSAARRLGITAVASASLLQARLSRNLPAEIRAKLPGTQTDAQCAIQFARSTPGITVALVGMSSLEHAGDNLALAKVSPATEAEYWRLFGG
jgi:aryl-alcohol dehydrogenase-like predicted oxidoreductase